MKCGLVMFLHNCPFWHYQNGIYDIVAKVLYFHSLASQRMSTFTLHPFRLFPFALVHTHSASFKTTPNLHSWVTFSKSVLPFCPWKSTNYFEQIRTLPPGMDMDSLYDCPARLTISGQVQAVQKDIHTFVITTPQSVRSAPQKWQLKICALLRFNPLWPETEVWLPVCNGLISFTGDFLAFESSVALVRLGDIVFIPRILLDNENSIIRDIPWSTTPSHSMS